jgi:hypothetical protein
MTKLRTVIGRLSIKIHLTTIIFHAKLFKIMQNYLKLLSIICVGLMMCGGSVSAAPRMIGEQVSPADETTQVKGVVLDSDRQPVIGATVVEVGTQNNGTLTGADGSFTLTISKGASVRISYVGYKTVTVKPTAGRSVQVVLEEDSEILNDVVVVGYGTQQKKLVTGSTVHVTAESIEAVNAVDAFGALQSLASGMNIVMNSGQPGEG